MIFLWVSLAPLATGYLFLSCQHASTNRLTGRRQRGQYANGGRPSVDDQPEAKIATLWPSPPNSDRLSWSLEG